MKGVGKLHVIGLVAIDGVTSSAFHDNPPVSVGVFSQEIYDYLAHLVSISGLRAF